MYTLFSKKHSLPHIHIIDVIHYPVQMFVRRKASLLLTEPVYNAMRDIVQCHASVESFAIQEIVVAVVNHTVVPFVVVQTGPQKGYEWFFR